MNLNENIYNIEKITDGVISYLAFIKNFKNVKPDDIILSEPDKNTSSKYSYIFREFKTKCFIIDKIYFDEFRSAINFNELYPILDPINEKNINLFKEELKKYLEKNPFNFNKLNVKFYSKKEELKGIVKNLNNYSFINEELLVKGMGIEELKLKGNLLTVSKNEKNTSLYSVYNNILINIINESKKIEENNDEENNIEYKNLYYVEEITKKIFILLIFNEKILKEKIRNKIKDIYNFKKYYLINKDWLKKYKDYFLFDQIKKKIELKYQNYSYKRIKCELDNISRNEIGRIMLYNETKIPKELRNYSKLKPIIKEIKLKKFNNDNKEYLQETIENEENTLFIEIPTNFVIINEDIFDLLKKEEFFYNKKEDNKDALLYEILLGNNQIIIKNTQKEKKSNENQFLNSYLIYINNIKQKESNEKIEENFNYTLKYILDYDRNFMFFDNFGGIIKKNLNQFISENEIDLDKLNYEQNIYDNNKTKNILGKFINIGIINEEEIRNVFDVKNDNNNVKNIGKNEKYLEIYESKTFHLEYIGKNQEIYDKNKLILDNQIEFKIINNKNDIISINSNKEINKEINYKNKYNDTVDNCENNFFIENDFTIENIESFSFNINEDSKIQNQNYKEIFYDVSNNIEREIELLEPYLEKLIKKVINNKERNNLDLKALIPEEIIYKKESKDINRIILMNDISAKDIKSFIKYDLINDYLNLKEIDKKKFVENNKDEFIQLIKILKLRDGNPTELPLIENYSELKKDIENKRKFFLLYNDKFQEIYQDAKTICIYFFIYKNESYIFFEKERKILKLKMDKKFEENYLYMLNEYEINRLELLQSIKTEMDKNTNLNNLEKYLKQNIKEYYLINKNWIKEEIDYEERINIQKKENLFSEEKLKESIIPNLCLINEDYLKYPDEFNFIEKEKFEFIIKYLQNNNQNIIENIYFSKLFFVNWDNNIPKTHKKDYPQKIYIGIMDRNNNDIIYFYFCNDGEYIFQFIIQFLEEKTTYKEIEKIREKGIGKYIFDSGNDFSSIEEPNDLIDDDLKHIGIFINGKLKEKKDDIWFPLNSKNLKSIDNSKYFTGVLVCLINLGLFQNFFLNRNDLVKNVKEDSIYIKYFYKIINDLWNSQDKDLNTELYISFFNEIKKKNYDSDNIFSNIKLLIDFLFLRLHEEEKVDLNKQKIIFSEEQLYLTYNSEQEIITNFYINQSFIQKLFLFDFKLIFNCNYCQNKQLKYFISFSLDFDIEQSNDKITIYNILDNLNMINIDDKCDKCKESREIKKIIISCPIYLIIIIRSEENCNSNFVIEEDINIKKYVSNEKEENTNYELVSLIKDTFITICKSPRDNKWYKYDGRKGSNEINMNKNYGIKNKKEIYTPFLLIYKNKKINQKNNNSE